MQFQLLFVVILCNLEKKIKIVLYTEHTNANYKKCFKLVYACTRLQVRVRKKYCADAWLFKIKCIYINLKKKHIPL